MKKVKVLKQFCNLPVGLVLTLNESTQEYEIGQQRSNTPRFPLASDFIESFFEFAEFTSISKELVDYNPTYFEVIQIDVWEDARPVESNVEKAYEEGEHTIYKRFNGDIGSMPTEFFNELFYYSWPNMN